ncbi:MAG: bifunctional phosphopantothenoylcysteine decarboxylase/phosphopantothenate--cysteine ligase CoaBC [Syntrophales bacterium]|nr:bifunctional phosphopantothenoylcysteine decarboxylase/phosphopantothenate--cysteine ligase CoaBC [Syntrophales bacterium]
MNARKKNVLLGICGGIAAYKAAELTRLLYREGFNVRVVMTKNAKEFITALTFQVLSGNPVLDDMFAGERSGINHIALADFAELFVIAPATANVIGKIAAGIADDLLTTTVMAVKCPVIICPSMNVAMYENSALQENLEILRKRGIYIIEPVVGELACGVEGKGRLPEPNVILEEIIYHTTEKDLTGERILVTAGPTREPFDPVRFITNYSSGKMGYAIARAARRRGARVVLVSGPTSLEAPQGVRVVNVESARDMYRAVLENLDDATVVIKAAAVADYRPAVAASSKIKKRSGPLTLTLERNPDIIGEIGKRKGNRIVVGFAMETENLLENALQKLKNKGMDLIVANELGVPGAGFQSDTNVVKIVMRDGSVETLPLLPKIEVANAILDRVKMLIERRT